MKDLTLICQSEEYLNQSLIRSGDNYMMLIEKKPAGEKPVIGLQAISRSAALQFYKCCRTETFALPFDQAFDFEPRKARPSDPNNHAFTRCLTLGNANSLY